MTAPLGHMMTAMMCVLSNCNNGAIPAFIGPVGNMTNVMTTSPNCDAIIEAQLNNFQKNLQNVIESNQQKLGDLYRHLNQVKLAAAANTPANRAKRYVASDAVVPTSLPQDCNGRSEPRLLIGVRDYALEPYEVRCERNRYGSGWLVAANVDSQQMKVHDYDSAFGDLDGEFFMGLPLLHAITNSKLQSLLVMLIDMEEVEHFGYYSAFGVAGEDENFKLNLLGNFKGDMPDILRELVGKPFSLASIVSKHEGRLRLLLKAQEL